MAFTMHVTGEAEAAAMAPRAAARPAAFELKGIMAALTVLRLRTLDVTQIERQLRARIAQMPQFFEDAPVVFDLGGLPDHRVTVPFAGLVAMMRSCRLIPVGVTNVTERMRGSAVAVGLSVLPSAPAGPARGGARAEARPDVRSAAGATPGPRTTGHGNGQASARQSASAQDPEATPPPVAEQARHAGAGRDNQAHAAESRARAGAGAGAVTPAPVGHKPPIVVRQPVRGGQVIYAQGTDIVVLAPVNPGAEVIADGHVHIYSTLRGRAVAGAQGYADARIFCQRLEPELVAVAGAYLLADDIPRQHRGRAVQIHMEAGECRINPL